MVFVLEKFSDSHQKLLSLWPENISFPLAVRVNRRQNMLVINYDYLNATFRLIKEYTWRVMTAGEKG